MSGKLRWHQAPAGLAASTVAVLALTVSSGAASPGPARPGHGGGPCRNGYVGLTFDDGPSATLPQLLDALRSSHLRATMFDQDIPALGTTFHAIAVRP
jgi:peptidoglycan/xylan/chitin deacetylase (PgdA/CDA1 family)